MTTVALIVGAPQHGVVVLARQLARADAAVVPVCVPDIDALSARSDLAELLVGTVHVHFTDQLFGPRCDLSAAAFTGLVERIGGHAAVSVTLHDVPQPEDEPGRYARRSAAYAQVVHAVAGRVVVNSEHEAELVRAFADVDPVVIALPVEPVVLAGRPAADADVVVLGFVYPGKGHAQAIDALDGLPADIGLVALGRAADGHEPLLDELAGRAARAGRRFSATGYLPETQLVTRMRRARVPLAAHRSISASGSIGSWLSAGRRPLVPDGPWTRELAARMPGAVQGYEPTPRGLHCALLAALARPDSTWLPADVRLTPSHAEAAALYAAALAEFDRVRYRAGRSR